ncbi:PaaI family thioesterase [Brevundimonas sp.]|jgi:uncharacterized protein (TIGR00369 family)|uniref:PaaI family thioesterase n=2 Tax=Pseudomonadota TaxID=1224 RepID=A0AAJ6BIY5_9CAUL|nr:PaaI family thioesterase [Brevundimonas sp.]WEK38823.1 MAG: PaaI family thioesterase [Brevundimonas sp.]
MTETLDIAALSGVEQLRLGLSGGFVAPIARTVGFDLTEVEEGRVVFEAVPTAAVYNPLGSVHGGWIATVLDSACGCVVHSTLRPGQTYTTLELKTVFHKALSAGTPVRAEGRIVQAGRRAAFAEADLRGLDGRLYATATSTCLVMER